MKKDPTGYNASARAQMERLGVNFSTSRELLALADARPGGLCSTPLPVGMSGTVPSACR